MAHRRTAPRIHRGARAVLGGRWRVATFVNLPTQDGLIATTTLISFSESERQFLDRKTLGQKIKALRESFPGLISSRWGGALRGLVALRNCLAHGRGIVREPDLTSSKRLFITWKVYEFVLEDQRGKLHTMEDLAQYGSPGGMLGIRSIWRRRFFGTGSCAHFSVQEFGEIIMSLSYFAYDVRERLGGILKGKNLLPTDHDLTPRLNISIVDLSPLLAAITPWASHLEQEMGKVEIYAPQSADASGRIDLTLRSLQGRPLPKDFQGRVDDLSAKLRAAVSVHIASSAPTTGFCVYPSSLSTGSSGGKDPMGGK